MSSAQVASSNTPIPTTEADNDQEAEETQSAPVESSVTFLQWDAFQAILSVIYNYRTGDGHDPSKVFHRKPNRRVYPAYYEVISEPIALSTIKARLNLKQYKDVPAIVRDFVLIPHNAQVYNRPESGAYVDALDIKRIFASELRKAVEKGVITEKDAQMPYLGEIPEPDEPLEEGIEDDESENDEDESGEESDESGPKKRGRGRPRKGFEKQKPEPGSKEEAELAAKKKKGRPPKVDTPMEARIKNILKAIRKPKVPGGVLKISYFDRLPDKEVMPEYYVEIKNPLAVDTIKKRIKRKKYQSVEHFLKDVDLIFDNAKLYNEDESQIYQIAVELQQEAHKVADEELSKLDTEFVDEEGRIPLPNGIMHNGELYKVGDWVHIQNANDLTKPIPTQIYRTWQDAMGNKYVNACWYYRPEQTVHRHDKHFYENEVFKTGQYRDHQIDEIVDRCFIMFVTRFGKGRPRGFPLDKEIYVCESRYNEEVHRFNKIKTWASCLPDEMRDKDYEMEGFQEPRRTKKVKSPISYLLKDEQKETDDLPELTWGADNAPPKIGAVHNRPRDPKDSPPPPATPPPPSTPEVKQEPAKQTQSITQLPLQGVTKTSSMNISNTPQRPANASVQSHVAPAQTMAQRQYPQNTTPAPLARTPSNFNRPTSSSMQPTPPRLAQPPATIHGPIGNRGIGAASAQGNVQNYQAPQPVEVYHLQDAVNNNIPPDIRSQFQCDDYGRLLFFTTPPINVRSARSEGAGLGHSAKYLAAMQRRNADQERKRKREENDEEEVEVTAAQKKQADQSNSAEKAKALRLQAEKLWQVQMREATKAEFQRLYGGEWERRMAADLEVLREVNLREELAQ